MKKPAPAPRRQAESAGNWAEALLVAHYQQRECSGGAQRRGCRRIELLVKEFNRTIMLGLTELRTLLPRKHYLIIQ